MRLTASQQLHNNTVTIQRDVSPVDHLHTSLQCTSASRSPVVHSLWRHGRCKSLVRLWKEKLSSGRPRASHSCSVSDSGLADEANQIPSLLTSHPYSRPVRQLCYVLHRPELVTYWNNFVNTSHSVLLLSYCLDDWRVSSQFLAWISSFIIHRVDMGCAA
jgi:hypothetical protein